MTSTPPAPEPPPAATPDAPAPPSPTPRTPVPRRRVLVLGGLGALAAATTVAVTRWHDVDSAVAAVRGAAPVAASGLFGADRVHEVVLAIDDAAFAQAVATYRDTGDKAWLEVDVTLDGTTYERCGVRLKGNSTLRRLEADAGPEAYPWLIRLDRVVEGQDHHGVTEVVLRANNSASSLNEAVALDLLSAAGLASQDHGYAAVRVGDASVLRLVLEHPGDTWADRALPGDGILYKAEATGDYTYRGTDPASYDEVFDQESGETDDLAPLIEFLRFVDESTDAEFEAGLPERLDVEAFATYLALEDLMDNYDAIDGPGNNSYLWWDATAGRMTVAAWDHNLTFGVSNRPGGQGAGQGRQAQGGAALQGGGGRGPGGRAANPFVTRFEAVPAFATLVAQASTRLRTDLFTGGVAATSLRAWSTLLAQEADGLVDAATLEEERAAITAYLD